MSASVLIAPDSFKGFLSAVRVAESIADGWASVRPGDSLALVPQADGGEGTLDAIEASVPGSTRRDAGEVLGPDERPVRGEWLELADGTAVVELAQMCGLPLMSAPDPMGATTYGLGQVIRAVVEAGARRLVVGLGGSASTDGGSGALAALGLRAPGAHLRAAELRSIRSLDRSDLLAPPPDGVVLLTDVTNPLLGDAGAAAVFGPQKGATPGQIAELDAALARFARLLGGDPDQPGSGAAGGTAFGLASAWGAAIEPGASFISSVSGLDDRMRDASVLITGEGRFDATSTAGKLVGRLLRLAGEHGVSAGVIAGQLAAVPTSEHGAPVWCASLSALADSADAAMADTAHWLRVAGADAARALGASVAP